MTPEQIESSVGVSDALTFTEYLEEVKRHVEQELTQSEVQNVRDSYLADYSVHETISQLDLI